MENSGYICNIKIKLYNMRGVYHESGASRSLFLIGFVSKS